MKSEGADNRERMVRLSQYASKYSFLLLALVAIPIIAEMDTLLQVWLKDVPEHTGMFCRLMLVASLCDQITVGLTSANQAIGKIRVYSLVFYTLKLLVIVAGWICLHYGLPIVSIMWCYVGVELMTSLVRLPLMKWIAGIEIWPFCKQVFGRIAVPCAAMVVVCYAMTQYVDVPYRVFLTAGASVAIGVVTIWMTALTEEEKNAAKRLLFRV